MADNATWQLQLAGKELCGKFKHSVGAWHKILPFFEASEQVGLQGLDHWCYDVGIPRALPCLELATLFYFPAREYIHQVQRPSGEVEVLSDIDNFDWFSVQVGRDVFQAKLDTTECRILHNIGWSQSTPGHSQFRVVHKSPRIGEDIIAPSFCRMGANKFIFATGGEKRSRHQKSVERFDIAKNHWTQMPELNVGRFSHGSLAIGHTLYVYGGKTRSFRERDSIEKLIMTDELACSSSSATSDQEQEAVWLLIKIDPKSLSGRVSPVMAALNDGMILIMGGRNSEADDLNDAYTFDVKDNSVRTISEAMAPGFCCVLGSSAPMQYKRNTIMVQVSCWSSVKLMEFTLTPKEENKFSIRFFRQN